MRSTSRLRSVPVGERRAPNRTVRQLDHDPESLVWARKQAGFTQKQVAEALGISPGHMSEIESGKRNATPRNLTALAKLLNCPRPVLERKYVPPTEGVA
jgi:DNA-binding XRE family transcriptional regulator